MVKPVQSILIPHTGNSFFYLIPYKIRHGNNYINYNRLGNSIREERHRLNLTEAQLAENIDISDTYMGAIERGERSLILDTLERLVNRLGVTIDYLLADSR